MRLLVLAVVGLAATGCGSPDITGPRVESAMTTTFTNLYVRQQAQLGRTAVPADVQAAASCARLDPREDETSAGDWVCRLVYVPVGGQQQVARYEVLVRPDACFMATGPATVVGPQVIGLPDGEQLTNPLFEFDGCFDTT